MINFYNKLYSSIKNRNLFLTYVRFYTFLRVTVRVTANIVLPIYFKLTANNPAYRLKNKDQQEPKLIVSFTSFPRRIKRVWLVIETILRQTHKPDKIILWLSKEQFADINQLPKRLLDLRKRGLVIELKKDDLRSHKKYYYSVKEYPNDILITIDDDILYPTNMIESLSDAHNIYPESVIARYGNKIKSNSTMILPYKEWEKNYVTVRPDAFAFFGSGGGTLFPIGSFPLITTDKDVFMKVCPLADDIWLNSMIRINERSVYMLESNKVTFLPVLNIKNVTLASQNLGEHLNDNQMKNVRDYFIKTYKKDPFCEVLI